LQCSIIGKEGAEALANALLFNSTLTDLALTSAGIEEGAFLAFAQVLLPAPSPRNQEALHAQPQTQPETQPPSNVNLNSNSTPGGRKAQLNSTLTQLNLGSSRDGNQHPEARARIKKSLENNARLAQAREKCACLVKVCKFWLAAAGVTSLDNIGNDNNNSNNNNNKNNNKNNNNNNNNDNNNNNNSNINNNNNNDKQQEQ